MLWVDPTDPEVFAAVAGADPTDADPEMTANVNRSIAIASEILTLATAFLVHPAGEQTEEAVTRHLRRWSPVYGPVTEVVSLVKVLYDGTEHPLTFCTAGNTVQVREHPGDYGSVPLWRTNWGPAHREHTYRLTYRFGSTITPAAREMVLEYAREFALWMTGSNDCALPDNVTSIDREGLGIQLATPQDFLDRGRTGLAKIDTWLSQVNAKRALRPSGVYTPDSPPGVGMALRRLP
jgi:hypothetical protein